MQSRPRREAMWAATGKDTGAGLPKRSGAHIVLPWRRVLDVEVYGLMFVLPSLSLALFCSPLLPLGWEEPLDLGSINLLCEFHREQFRVGLESQRGLWIQSLERC